MDVSMSAETSMEELVGCSKWADDVRRRVPQIARHRYNVSITGAEGTGKRLLARLVHGLSPRADNPMIPVDCSLLGPKTFAGQLFGHEAGAFPGAVGPALGCFRAADAGTLYLAHVETLALDLQEQLLAALKTRHVMPIGGDGPIAVDVRVITASVRDLQKQIQDRHLLPELYTTLDAVSLRALPLSKRLEDIEPLANHFLADLAEEFDEPPKHLAADGLQRLKKHTWPGNVAELREAMERAAVFWDGDELSAEAFGFLHE
jgi:DNA-binding NtrC family response regulator